MLYNEENFTCYHSVDQKQQIHYKKYRNIIVEHCISKYGLKSPESLQQMKWNKAINSVLPAEANVHQLYMGHSGEASGLCLLASRKWLQAEKAL